MTIRFLKPFVKEYRRLPQPIKDKVDRSLKLLAYDLHRPGVKARKMAGQGEI